MTTLPVVTADGTRSQYVGVGRPVWLYAFGRWFPGRVTSVGRTRLTVSYTTKSGVTRTKRVAHNAKGLVRA